MVKFFRKLRQETGQSIIEYALLIILVLGGVYVMSPYVIRSWNANIKGFDDAVKDSYREPIEPSPPGVLDVSCDSGYGDPCQTPPCCGYGSCEEYERTTAWLTNPIGCADPPGGVTFQCNEDAACCTTPVKLPVPDFCTDPRCPDPTQVPALFSCGFEDHVNPPNFVCQYDRNCDLQCLNPPNPADPQYEPAICPNDNINLTIDTNVTFVEYGKCSTPAGSAPKCQWECVAGFVPAFGASSCECPAGSINLSGVCVIDCTLSEGDCALRSPLPVPPIPQGCGDLNFAECDTLYGALCRWNPSTGCEQERGCDELLTNITLFYPTEDDDPAFARCEFFPWCQWSGGGGYCCMAVQRNACSAVTNQADGSGCPGNEVLACCQFDVTGQCNLNGQSCALGTDCCSNNCVGGGAPLGPLCCLPGQTGVCNGGSNNGDCCAGAANCPGGACVP